MRICSFLCDDQIPKVIDVEYHARFQIPTFQILGLPGPEIQEARERVMAAFQAADLEFPKKKVIVNLAPSSVRKSGTGHDLPIALKVLSETQDLEWSEATLAWGELSLDGTIKAKGKMAALTELLLQNENVFQLLVLASEDAKSFRNLLNWRHSVRLPIPTHLRIYAVEHFQELSIPFIANEFKPERVSLVTPVESEGSRLLPLAPSTERLLKISLIGKHHVLLLGPKGMGKSESLRWFKALSPDADPKQVWERLLHSESRDLPFSFRTPLRQVHAQVRPAHLLGSFNSGGYRAGELALAHGGQFIADEFMEWPRDAKECLREPLQSKKVTLTRVRGSIEAHCDFQFIATGNLCPCGGLPQAFRAHDSKKRFTCRCRAAELQTYLHKLSGPILDRIDLTLVITDSALNSTKTDSRAIQAEIKTARKFALDHFGKLPATLGTEWLEENLPKDATFENLLKDLPSLRSRHKVMRVARSIQALEKSKNLQEVHLFEAKTYRLAELN